MKCTLLTGLSSKEGTFHFVILFMILELFFRLEHFGQPCPCVRLAMDVFHSLPH